MATVEERTKGASSGSGAASKMSNRSTIKCYPNSMKAW